MTPKLWATRVYKMGLLQSWARLHLPKIAYLFCYRAAISPTCSYFVKHYESLVSTGRHRGMRGRHHCRETCGWRRTLFPLLYVVCCTGTLEVDLCELSTNGACLLSLVATAWRWDIVVSLAVGWRRGVLVGTSVCGALPVGEGSKAAGWRDTGTSVDLPPSFPPSVPFVSEPLELEEEEDFPKRALAVAPGDFDLGSGGACFSLRTRVRQTTQRRGRHRCVTATWIVLTKHFRQTTRCPHGYVCIVAFAHRHTTHCKMKRRKILVPYYIWHMGYCQALYHAFNESSIFLHKNCKIKTISSVYIYALRGHYIAHTFKER